MNTPDQTIDLGSLRGLIEQLELTDIRLVASESKQAIPKGPLPKSANLTIHVAIQHELANQTVRIRIEFRQESRFVEKSDDVPLLVAATYQMTYKTTVTEAYDEVPIRLFGETYGLFTLWPFWREFMNSNMRHMGLPYFNTPLIPPNMQTVSTPSIASNSTVQAVAPKWKPPKAKAKPKRTPRK